MLGDLDGHKGRQLRGSRYADNPKLGQAAPLVHLGRQYSVPARHFRHIRSRRRRLRQHRKLLLDIKPAPSLYAPQQLDRRVRHRSCAIASSSSKPASRILTPPTARRPSPEGNCEGAVAAMIPVPSGVRVWLAVGHTDMRRGMNSLAVQVQQVLKRDPHAGDLYVFRGKRGHLVKILWHDGIGMSLYAKRLERGRFIWPSPAD